ncbi:MAG TPA: quinone oxidoreductase [Bryobacteraceae bacterium]|nr:quinone oxidoreductase [Bryobacteraceae bacterium]
MKAIIVRQNGGPEQLRYENTDQPKPAAGHVLVRLAAAGVNFIDVYQRTGLYKVPVPFTPGQEGAGVIEAVGDGVSGWKAGDRVAYVTAPGSYAEYATVPTAALVKVPDGMDLKQAAAAMLQGMTAHYLTRSTFPLKRGDTCLVHAVAGGVGLILTQMAKALGAKVIGTTSTDFKAELAKKAGADEVIIYTDQDFEGEVKRITKNRGVDVVYDSVGATTWTKSVNSLRPRGMMVSFGNASGPVPPVEPLLLTQKGSLFLTRPKLADYMATPDELKWRAGDVLGDVAAGKLKLRVEHTYPLAEAQQAHRDLEARKTTGKLLLLTDSR